MPGAARWMGWSGSPAYTTLRSLWSSSETASRGQTSRSSSLPCPSFWEKAFPGSRTRPNGRRSRSWSSPLRRLPQRVHLLQRRLRRRLPLGGEALLDLGEALAELAVGAGEGGFGVDLQLAGEVGHGEEEVPHLLAHGVLLPPGERLPELLDLLLRLGEHGRGVRPVEADAGRLLGQAVGAEQGGERGGDPREERLPLRLLLQLAPLPGLAHRRGVGQRLASEDVRVALHHLAVDAVDHL